MFVTIDYEVTFSTGRTLSAKIEFSSGLSAIQGPNESGKSFVLEMLRFSLFGSSALRGVASGYTRINVKDCKFRIKGLDYRVQRTLKNAMLFRGAEPIATGTTAVNTKIQELLGFGLGVFDIACVANQGDLERLSNMSPAERRRVVDSVIGIGALEVLARWAGDEALLRTREAGAIKGTLQEPIEPQRPDTEYDLSTLSEEIRKTQELQKQRESNLMWLSIPRQAPVRPQCKVDLSSEHIEPLARTQREKRSRLKFLDTHLQNIGTDWEPLSDQEIAVLEQTYDSWIRGLEATLWLKQNPMPDHDLQTLIGWQKDWLEIEAELNHRLDLQRCEKEIDQVEAALNHAKEHELRCVKCDHHWHPDQESIDRMQDRLLVLKAEFVKLSNLPKPPEKPPLDTSRVERMIKAWASFDQDTYDLMLAVPVLPDKGVRPQTIATERARQKLAEERLALQKEQLTLRQELQGQPDFEALLAERRAYETALIAFKTAEQEYSEWKVEKAKRELVVMKIPDQSARLSVLNDLHTQLKIHESLMERYERDRQAYETNSQLVSDLETAAEQYRRIKAGFVRLRTMIKQYLLPSLNAVASKLLRDMTGGQRAIIRIDDDFNIFVDNQSIETLSGSGKAIANLAIRIGLGQVLINNTISVFLADEIDSSMDSFRAENTSITLRSLQQRISQIIMVSHKDMVADHYIFMGETNERGAI